MGQVKEPEHSVPHDSDMMIDVMPNKEEEYKMSKEFVGLELIGPKRFQGEVCCAFVFCINWDLVADRLFCSSF